MNGLKHGKGKITWANSSYEGEFKDSVFDGEGHYKWDGGNEHKGMYVNYKRQGYGMFNYSDGRKYSGMYSNDKIDGLGTLS